MGHVSSEGSPVRICTFTRTCISLCGAIILATTSGCEMQPKQEAGPPDTMTPDVGNEGSPRHRWLVLPLPTDLSTDTQGSPIGVMVVNTDRASGKPPNESELLGLAGALGLATLDGTPVSTEVQIISPPSHDPTGLDGDLGDRPDHERHVRIELYPTDGLKPVWHLVTLDTPNSLFSPSGFYRTQDSSGSVASRFHPLPLAFFRSVRILVQQREKPTRVEIEFSQPVGPGQTDRSVVLCGASRCVALAPDGMSEASGPIWQFTCSCGPDDSVSIAIRDQILTADRQDVRTLAGSAVFEVTWPTDPAWQRDGDFWVVVP